MGGLHVDKRAPSGVVTRVSDWTFKEDVSSSGDVVVVELRER